ncbi:hypothetical protein [Streptomyces sp. DH7]|uniref:hypothetical protein n=1 Tax=Streptomyces sp. DH7 TaxID=2857006 RepID=UPI001E5161AD|nr:hypothetical protein [Streptomyces sp. DH7]
MAGSRGPEGGIGCAGVLLTENPAAYAWTVMRNRVIDHAARAGTRRLLLIDEAAFRIIPLSPTLSAP